ncbi:MAG: alpha/beta hydrolase [Gammaproteobacteria bacterium]
MPDDLSVLTRAARPPDEVVSYGEHPDHIADVRFGGKRAELRPLVLILHGGFWRPQYDRTHTGPMAEALADAGWTVASAEYRRIPGDPDATLHDVSEAFQKLPTKVRNHNGSVIVVGHSAGGHLALWIAARHGAAVLAGAVALGPAADLSLAHERKLGDGATLAFLGKPAQDCADVDPCRMPSPQVPTALVHGEEDDVVPIALSESYVAAHPRARLVRLPATGHFGVIDPLSAAWPTVMRELLALIPAAGPVPSA